MDIIIPEIIENICGYLSLHDVHNLCIADRLINQCCRGYTAKLLTTKFHQFSNNGKELFIAWNYIGIPNHVGCKNVHDFYIIFWACVIVFNNLDEFSNDQPGRIHLIFSDDTTVRVYPNEIPSKLRSRFSHYPKEYLEHFKTLRQHLEKCSGTSIKISDIPNALHYGKVAIVYKELKSRIIKY